MYFTLPGVFAELICSCALIFIFIIIFLSSDCLDGPRVKPMTIPIPLCRYGLLGPSGCGKTTLLKCIVGTLKILRGRITVLGKPPAFPGHQVPGRMVGYMPQVISCMYALKWQFSIISSLCISTLAIMYTGGALVIFMRQKVRFIPVLLLVFI